jgi:CBS domain-containing protein
MALMAAKGMGAVLAISEGNLIGTVSERDYAREVILQGRSPRETQVRDIMTADLATVTPEITVDDCMKVMTYSRIRHLPVLEGVGLLVSFRSATW